MTMPLQVKVVSNGVLSAEEIKAKSTIDKHYAALAASAVSILRKIDCAMSLLCPMCSSVSDFIHFSVFLHMSSQ